MGCSITCVRMQTRAARHRSRRKLPTLSTTSPTAMVDGPDKTVSRQRQQLFSSRIAYALFIYPVEFFLSLVASVLRPIAPQLIPFAVFFLLVPLLVVPAVISGLYVWYSRAISWETPLFFQYGCVLSCTQSGVSTHVLKAMGFHRTPKLSSPHLTLHSHMTYPSTWLFQLRHPTMILATS